MPPKKVDKGAQKAVEKAKTKIVEDKTFGLKNKNKSKAVQNFIKSVQAQVTGGRVKSDHELKGEQKANMEAKRVEKQTKALASLAKAQAAMRALNAANPGNTKAAIDSETAKIDIYSDPRDAKRADGIIPETTTDIICKFFLAAVEGSKYGYFWTCPSGDECQYRHALPQGYILKCKAEPETETTGTEVTIEDQIEQERSAISSTGTPVTYETFMAWKKKKEEEEAREAEESKTKREKESGRGELSGKALFQLDPSKFELGDTVTEEDDELQKLISEAREANRENERYAAEEAAERAASTRGGPPAINRSAFLAEPEDIDPNDLEG